MDRPIILTGNSIPSMNIHSLTFRVGNEPLNNFRMIERHYFRNQLIRSYDFSFGFCIGGSMNTWEAIYDMPPISASTIEDMVAHPYDTTSDSFYFVGNEMIMHNKASYRYVEGEGGIKASLSSSEMEIERLSLVDR